MLSLADLVSKYGTDGEISDWPSVSNDDLYEYLDSNREGLQTLASSGVLLDQEWAQEVRRRSRADLEWLAGYFTHETNPETSGKPIQENLIRKENVGPFFDFFVKKDNSKTLAEQSEIKNRLLLYPRGGMKSSTGLIDIVQWILNFPEIRILIMTAADDLAVKILDEVKGHFILKLYEPSFMNLFFPEFCLVEKDLTNQYEFTCPVWAAKQIRRREPTIIASSITSTLSGFHFELMHLDDAVSNRNSENEDQCAKVNKNFKINKKMLRPFGYCTKIGTRYHDCLVAGTPILMADWSQKSIENIQEGDVVVGWETKVQRGKGHRRVIRPTKVLAVGQHESRKVYRYTFESGRSVIATDTHKWWKGPHGGGSEYKNLGLSYHKMKSVRRLLTPTVLDESRAASWLAGMYDGEGSFQKNKHYNSGTITIAQTMHNPDVLEKIRETLTKLNFLWNESRSYPENSSAKCEFILVGGWRERYRFLREIAPTRDKVISNSLWGQLLTEEDKLVSIEPAGERPVYFFQTETGNYVADGCCSKNSDMYGLEIEGNVGDLNITEGPGWTLTENTAADSLILVGRAITIKPEVRRELIDKGISPSQMYQEAGEDGCILLMPKVLTFRKLIVLYNEDRYGGREEGTFEGQMNQNPVPEEQAVFDKPMLYRATVPYTEVPFQGIISHTWDFAFSGKKYRDFTTGCSVLWGNNGCAYVNDLVRDRFPNPTALAKSIVDMAVKHHPFVIGIEDAGASRFLEPTIIAEAQKTNDPFVIAVCGRIDWIPVTKEEGAKKARMAALQPLLVSDLLKFVSYLPYLETLYDEFIRCQGNLRRHNDIPDVISHQPRYAPRVMKQIADSGIVGWTWTQEQKDSFRNRAAYSLIYEEGANPFGDIDYGQYVSMEDEKNSEDYIPQQVGGLDPILGTMIG